MTATVTHRIVIPHPNDGGREEVEAVADDVLAPLQHTLRGDVEWTIEDVHTDRPPGYELPAAERAVVGVDAPPDASRSYIRAALATACQRLHAEVRTARPTAGDTDGEDA